MPEAPGPLTGVTVGRYRIGPLLGQGGMGEVYRAEDSELRRAVALKVLPGQLVADESRLSRFVQEARTASALNHPHLISIYDIGSGTAPNDTRVHFIAMELVDGDTLREFIARGTLDLRRVIEYTTQAADAVAAAHAAGIVHRDIKPENLMIARNAYVKVLDFGLAKLREEPALLAGASDQPTVAAATAPGMVMGTVGYMSPEQAEGKAVDHRSDIFAFGCVLYEAATGTRAFAGTSAVDTLHQIINVEPAPITARVQGAPPELQRIVSKCLAKDPEDRYQSMKEVAIDLRGLRRQIDSGPESQVGSALQAAPAPARGRWSVIAGAAAVTVVAALVLAFWLTRGQAPPSAASITIAPLTASGNVIDAVISKDGKYLAYAESLGGLQSLWLRQVNGSRAIQLVSPVNIGFWGLSFSPDAQSVYYGMKSSSEPLGALFQIPTLGGTPRKLLTDIDSAVTFSADGSRIAFYRANLADGSSTVVVANADGTNAHPLAEKRSPEFFAPGFYVAPSWSPDGKRIAAFVRNSATRDARLVTIDLEGGAEHAVGDRYEDGTFTAWLPDGSGILVAARLAAAYGSGNGGQLFLQPYPSGTRRRITNDLVEYRNISITGDGSQIVSVGFDVSVRMSLIAADGSNERRMSSNRYDGSRGLAWTPDGRILFARYTTGGVPHIWSMKADGSDAQEVVSEGMSSWPAVSPDGRSIAFSSVRTDGSGIWRADIDGSHTRLLATVSDPTHIVFAPDGGTVYFTTTTDGPPATYRVSVDGGTPTLVSALFERATPSPDGRFLAGVYRASPHAPITLAVLNAESGQPVTTFPDFSIGPVVGSVMWSVDGKDLLYTTAERFNIWRRPYLGGDPVKVTNYTDLTVVRFAPSPDGRWFALCRGATLRDAYLLTGF